MAMRVGSRKINGVDTEIQANEYGQFFIQVEGKTIGSGNTLDAAVVEARNSINREKTKVEVKFITRDGEPGVATGIHSRNHTVMAKIAGGRGEQLDYSYRCFNSDMPKQQVDRYIEITDQLSRLQSERSQIDNTWGMLLREAVQQAITEAQGKTLSGAINKAAERRAKVNPKRRY
jgi:hypothetical protein